MSIKSIELKFSEVGMTTPDQPRKANYIPVAVLTFDNRKTKKRVYLEGMLEDKRSVNGYFGGQTFIVLHVDEEFRVFDLQGTFQGAVSAAEYGTPIDGGGKIASFSAKAEPSRGYPIKESLVVQENSPTKNTQSTFRSK